MKKRYLSLVLSLMTVLAIAQTQHPNFLPDKLPPEIAKRLSTDVLANGAGGLHVDSLYYYSKLDPEEEWMFAGKLIYEYDCDIERILSQSSYNLFNGVFEPGYRLTYAYNSDGSIITASGRYQWSNTLNNWDLQGYHANTTTGLDSVDWLYTLISGDNPLDGYKQEFFYDSEDRLIRVDSFKVIPQTDEWEKNFITNYIYGPDGKLQTKLTQMVFFGNVSDQNRWTYNYNANGQLQYVLKERIFNSQWQPDSRITYFYNASGQPTLALEEVAGGMNWFNSARTVYTYNSAMQPTEILRQQSFGGPDWNNVSRERLNYYANGDTSSSNSDIWIGNLPDWANIRVDSLTEAGDIAFFLFKGPYDPFTNSFAYGYRTSYTYQNNNLMELSYDNLTLGTLDTWTPSGRSVNTYDAAGMAVISNIDYRWDTDLNDYIAFYKEDFFNSSCNPSGVDDPPATAVQCQFPNPYTPGQSVQFDGSSLNGQAATVSLFDASGSLALRQTVDHSSFSLPSVGLNNGLFFMVVESCGRQVCQGKVVVRE